MPGNFSYVFLLLTLVAEIIGTVGGFGSSVFFVPIANFYFDFHCVLGLTAVFHLASNLSKIALFKKGFNLHLLLFIGIPSIIFVAIGGVLSRYLKNELLELVLAIFLIGMSLLFLIKKKLVIQPGKKEAISGGILSGFTAGLLGTGGAVRGITMAAFNLEKNVFIATSAVIDLAIDSTRTVIYYQNGFIHQHDLFYIPFLFAIGLTGTFVGKYLLTFISQEKFKNLSLLLTLSIGVLVMIKLFLTQNAQ